MAFNFKNFEILDSILYELFGDVSYCIIDTIIENFQIFEVYNNKLEKIAIVERSSDNYALWFFGKAIDSLDYEKKVLFNKLANYFKHYVYLDEKNYSKIYKDYKAEIEKNGYRNF